MLVYAVSLAFMALMIAVVAGLTVRAIKARKNLHHHLDTLHCHEYGCKDSKQGKAKHEANA